MVNAGPDWMASTRCGWTEIGRRKARRRRHLERALRPLVSQLRRLGAERIVLFGSLAGCDTDVGSDIDIFVMMPPTRSGKEWLRYINDRLDRTVATDIIVRNREEFWRELGSNRLLRLIVSSGRTLYEKAI